MQFAHGRSIAITLVADGGKDDDVHIGGADNDVLTGGIADNGVIQL